jgi:hypothetical protein
LESKRKTRFTTEFKSHVTSSAVVRSQCSLTLEERCACFRREFKDLKISATTLRTIYKEAGVKRKQIRQIKTIPAGTQAKVNRQIRFCRDKLQECVDNNVKIMWLDECMFTRMTLPKLAFMPKYENIEYDQYIFNIPTIAFLGVVSKEDGISDY